MSEAFDKMMRDEHVKRLTEKLNEAVRHMHERSLRPAPMQIPCGSVEHFLSIKEMADCGVPVQVMVSCKLADELRELGHI